MLILCVVAMIFASLALAIAARPHLYACWEKHSRYAQLHRRIAMVKRL